MPIVIDREYNPKSLVDVPINAELVDWLDKTIPEHCPDVTDTDRQIWMYAGKRFLVRQIKAAFEKQKNLGLFP